MTAVLWLYALAICAGIAWDVYQGVVRRRVAMPVRVLGGSWYIERDREPGMFWLVAVAHGLFWLISIAVLVADAVA
jgi:hypothetical protein